MRRFILLTLALIVLTLALLAAVASGKDKLEGPNGEHKVVVCKYVGTPGVDETLQTGDNPLLVDYHSVPGFTGTFPYAFADAQGQSIAIRWSFTDGSISECPGYVPPIVCEEGTHEVDGECIPDEQPPEDVCPNLEGVQTSTDECPVVPPVEPPVEPPVTPPTTPPVKTPPTVVPDTPVVGVPSTPADTL
jgi:hypothetical protein